MERVLVVEDSNILGSLIKRRVEIETGLAVDHAVSYAQAVELTSIHKYFATVIDLNLPDAEKGYMAEFAQDRQIPAIVYTGDYDSGIRSEIWKKGIVDYVLKRDPESDIYVAKQVKQLMVNRTIDVLVADDSRLFRTRMQSLLDAHLFRVHVCKDGKEAFDIAQTLKNLKLIISDNQMPDITGFDLVRLIRKKFPKDSVAFIGMSKDDSEELSARFIKYGANDFLVKPFSPEQFYTRVNQNIQNILLIDQIKEMSFKDYLTGLYNRRYFFGRVRELYGAENPKTIALLDIDFFKRVNDTYGHDCGDAVLKKFSCILSKYIGDDGIVARFGGEEFCIYTYEHKSESYFEELRKKIEEFEIEYENITLRVTASIGLCSAFGLSLDDMISHADSLLYKAKQIGRNRICSES